MSSFYCFRLGVRNNHRSTLFSFKTPYITKLRQNTLFAFPNRRRCPVSDLTALNTRLAFNELVIRSELRLTLLCLPLFIYWGAITFRYCWKYLSKLNVFINKSNSLRFYLVVGWELKDPTSYCFTPISL